MRTTHEALAMPRLPVVAHRVLSVDTTAPLAFVDLTAPLLEAVAASGLIDGLVVVQTWHTTTGLMINEHEPLLLEDLAAMFERLVPEAAGFAHDDFTRRRVNLMPGERRNGHAHCRAALLRTSEWLPVSGGAPTRGRWQCVVLGEVAGPQRRRVSFRAIGSM